MYAEIKTKNTVDFRDIKVGNTTLYDLLYIIKQEIHKTVSNVSFERQQEVPDLELIDVSLHSALNRLEDLGFN
jgi:hypothetical protein